MDLETHHSKIPVLDPRCTLNDLQDEFLPDVRPVIDVSAGSRVRLLVQMVLAESGEPFTMPDLMERCNVLQGPEGEHSFGKQAARTYRTYAQKWLTSEGLVDIKRDTTATSNQVGSNPATFTATEKGRQTLPTLGALATFQLRHDIPLATFWGSAPTGEPMQPSPRQPYPNYPTGRLRIIQSAIFSPVTSGDFSSLLGHGPTQDTLRRLVNDEVLTRDTESHPMRYTIRPEMIMPAVELLLTLRSLRDDAYAEEAEAAASAILKERELTATLLKPLHTAQDQTKEDAVARQPLAPSQRLPRRLMERVRAHAPDRQEKVALVRQLLALQSLGAITLGQDGTCDFVEGIHETFTPAERQALARQFGLQDLVSREALPAGAPLHANVAASLVDRMKKLLSQDKSPDTALSP